MKRAAGGVVGTSGLVLVAVGLSVLGGCQAQRPSAEAASAAFDPSAKPASPSPPPPPPSPPRPQPAPASPPPLAPPPPERSGAEVAAELCDAHCARVEAACPASVSQFCRPSCADFNRAAVTCPYEVHEALICQSEAEKYLLCSNVTSTSCGPVFRAMKDCSEGRTAARTSPFVAVGGSTPAGYVRAELPEFGGSFLVPIETPDEKTASRLAVSHGAHQFVIEHLSVVSSEPTPRQLLAAATKYVGAACEAKLRLFGRFDKGDRIHLRFTTTCKDGTPWAGIFILAPSLAVAASIRSKAPETKDLPAELETFLFGFEPKGGFAPIGDAD